MDWLKFGLGLLKAWNGLVALLRQWRDREAGRNETVLEVKENSDDALAKAEDSRAAQRRADADGGELRRDDGYRRD